MSIQGIKECKKRWVKNNPEKVKKSKKQWEENNPQYYKQYYKDNLKKIKEWGEKYYIENHEKINERQKKYREDNHESISEYQKQYHQEKRKWLVDYKLSRGCVVCGYKKCASALDFHHNGDKEFDIARGIRCKNLEQIQEEIKKCMILCRNCHSELHEKEKGKL